jgi:hypothetical protein
MTRFLLSFLIAIIFGAMYVFSNLVPLIDQISISEFISLMTTGQIFTVFIVFLIAYFLGPAMLRAVDFLEEKFAKK